ncbi:phosphoglycerate mutase-like protein [Abortiporus biennis]|nr:phosphoglycerate mutase-like protein [Abortiporus biennis]
MAVTEEDYSHPHDLETGEEYRPAENGQHDEHEALLPSPNSRHYVKEEPDSSSSHHAPFYTKHRSLLHVALSFIIGIAACLFVQLIIHAARSQHEARNAGHPYRHRPVGIMASEHAGSTEVHEFPPVSPTNVFPSLFPTDVGHAGPTPTGAEPALIATAPAYPLHTGAPNLLAPKLTSKSNSSSGKTKADSSGEFDLFKHWGNLSPWFSVEKGGFGLDSSPEAPDTCRVTGLHFLHRHGARYPTSYAAYGGPANFSSRLHATASGWNGHGDLDFMNDWTYKLGEEVLTPFGRQQLFDLGVSMRIKYGYLLKNFTESQTLPVFRTESQDRMLASALNFAIGFFGYPFEGLYQQSITIEANGFNNTLAPYKTCPNAQVSGKSDRSLYYVREWAKIYLANAHARLAPLLRGYSLTIEDIYTLQQMCAYETVAIGYSKFCELFTEEEWKGFNYALDLFFWYDSGFGSPLARVQGIGYVQELVARLTHTPIAVHNSSTNATLNDNPVTFPLGQSLYVDATHEVVVLNILTALNLTNFAENGPLPHTHIPEHRTFKVSHLAPFATNVQFQLLSCTTLPEPQIRIVINDGVTPLTSIKGCPEQKDGMCPLETFIESMKEMINTTDWEWGCHGDWQVPPGTSWNTTTGYPPERPY